MGSPHSQLDCPVAFPEDGIRGQGKAVGTETPPTALLFWCGFCLKPNARMPLPAALVRHDHRGLMDSL
jgi:hypothetical protein